MTKRIGRNEPCPCCSGKKYKKCHYIAGSAVLCHSDGEAVIEVITYPEYGENVCGIFRYATETHRETSTGETYRVRIYSSVLDILENNAKLRQKLCSTTHQLLFELRGPDVAFVRGDDGSDDFLIWHNRRDQYVMWFTVTQAKSYFGSNYEVLGFDRVERLPWGHWAQNAEEAVSNE
jgi:SEC-C motif